MTFLNTRFRLRRELTPRELERLNQVSTLYGVRGLSFENGDLVVEYDASRIHEAEALAAIRAAGVPVSPPQAIPAGAFDLTGEFREFAWPTTGLSPANRKS